MGLETWVSRVLQHPSMKAVRWQARTRTELMIEVWEALDCESVGERELIAIQAALLETFGAGAIVSPAAIARELADEGAVLRHPEVLLCDTKWRECQLAQSTFEAELDFTSLITTAASLAALEKGRCTAEAEGDAQMLKRLRDLVGRRLQEAQLTARSKILPDHERSVAREIAQWLAIWLRQPDLFENWLSLRQRSPEYQQKYK